MQHLTTCLFLFVCLFAAREASAQKVLQIEKYGRAKTEKFYIGDPVTYQVQGEDIWHTRYIEDLLIDRDLIMFDDRYVALDDIRAFRYDVGIAKAASISLYTFGAAWSGFALVGTLTDGDPDTNYRASDAVVTGVSIGLGFLLGELLSKRTVKFGGRKRLRMLDLSFSPGF